MPQLIKRVSAALVTSTFLAMLAYVPVSRAEGTGQYMEDSVMTTKVKAAIVKELKFKATGIKVATDNGRVQLSGVAKSQADMDHAVQIAHGVEGVTSFQNEMHLK